MMMTGSPFNVIVVSYGNIALVLACLTPVCLTSICVNNAIRALLIQTMHEQFKDAVSKKKLVKRIELSTRRLLLRLPCSNQQRMRPGSPPYTVLKCLCHEKKDNLVAHLKPALYLTTKLLTIWT
jgi:hypothetical protein